ncbi:Iron-sulfur cluster assembly scaffold protein IscU [subsurface metagenome]
MDHFRNPRNMGEMKDADAIGEVGNPVCGDLMYIYIKVEEKNGAEIIKDISFQTFGCAAAIATSSILRGFRK